MNHPHAWLEADPTAASLMAMGATHDAAFEAVERVAIQHEGKPMNAMADALTANRIMQELSRRDA